MGSNPHFPEVSLHINEPPPPWAQTGPWHLLPKGTVFNLSASDRICSLLWNQWRLSLALHVLRGEGATVPSGSILICCAIWSLEREMSLPLCQPLTYHPTRRKQSCKSQCWKQLLRLSHPPPLVPGAPNWTGAELSSKALRTSMWQSPTPSQLPFVFWGLFKPQTQNETWEVGTEADKGKAKFLQ